MDAIHRVLTGQPLNRTELIVAGALVLLWFLMDLVQWIDWLLNKLNGVCG
jgi:hypothetical protein